jgi:hypothetical protein
MRLLWSLAGQAARVALFGSAIKRLRKKSVRIAIGCFLISIFGLLGTVYVLAGVRTELDYRIGPVWSPIAIGGVLLVGAFVAYLVFLKPKRGEAISAEVEHSNMRQRLMLPARQAEQQWSRHPLAGVGIAAGVGAVAAFLLSRFRNRP